MIEEKNKTKFYMNIFIGAMVVTSLITAWIMATNMNKDVSKERFKLTQDYKKFKKKDYTYSTEKGSQLYASLCMKCHGKQGQGRVNAYPPLADAPLVITSPEISLKIIVKGMRGEISRQGRMYNGVMPAFKAIGHTDLAHIINYIRQDLSTVLDETAKPEIIHPLEVVKAKVDTLALESSITPEYILHHYQKNKDSSKVQDIPK